MNTVQNTIFSFHTKDICTKQRSVVYMFYSFQFFSDFPGLSSISSFGLTSSNRVVKVLLF